MSDLDLTSILTPFLLRDVLSNRIPWPRHEELDFTVVGPYFWRPSPSVSASFYALVFPALKALSLIPLSQLLAHDLLQYLPPPESTEFPPLALGLVLFLDQGARMLEGKDVRWKYDFFDPISQRLAKQLLDLGNEADGRGEGEGYRGVYSKERWLGEQGVSFGYWIVVRMWLQAPLQHSESIPNHLIARSINEYARKEVEAFTGTVDPNRGNEEILKDTLAYPRWTREGPPGCPGRPGDRNSGGRGVKVKMEEFAYWELLMMDVHLCIIERFRGYPQRYAARGREMTEDEKEYLERSENFDVIDDEEAKVVKGDVAAGRWTPLGG